MCAYQKSSSDHGDDIDGVQNFNSISNLKQLIRGKLTEYPSINLSMRLVSIEKYAAVTHLFF